MFFGNEKIYLQYAQLKMSEPLCVHIHVYFSTFEQQKLTQHALETGTLTSHVSRKGLVEKIHEKLKAVYCCIIILAVWALYLLGI